MNRRYDYGGGNGGGRGGYGGYGRDDRGGRRKGGNSLLDQMPRPIWDKDDLIPFQKNFYREHPGVTNRDPVQNEQYMIANRMSLENTKLKPIIYFQEICFPPPIMSVLVQMNFERPTPIQSASWPILLSGHDLVGIAQTGSGKTLAYLLPAVVQAKSQFHAQPGDGPIILVLAPTRELAQQIQSVANEFGEVSQCRNCSIYGGASKRTQMLEYRKGVELVIATPGRLIDFINTCEVSLHRVTYLVLDEADRMLDMGFEPQIRKIIEQIRPDRQTCMFSATWPVEVRRLANEFLSGAAYVTIGDRELSANHNITQIVEVCSEYDKDYKIRSVLMEIMRERNSKTIVFAQTKQRVRQYHRMLSHMGLPVLDIHGDKKQMERDRTLKDFREMRRAILIATDVASRGLDVTDVKFVVNIDYPPQTEDYIHRIGRTARSNHHGTSYTFFTIKNKREAPKLIKVLREAGQPVPEKLAELAGPGYHGSSGTSHRRHVDHYDRGMNHYDHYGPPPPPPPRRTDYDRGDFDRKRSRMDDYHSEDMRRERKYPVNEPIGSYNGEAHPYAATSSANICQPNTAYQAPLPMPVQSSTNLQFSPSVDGQSANYIPPTQVSYPMNTINVMAPPMMVRPMIPVGGGNPSISVSWPQTYQVPPPTQNLPQ